MTRKLVLSLLVLWALCAVPILAQFNTIDSGDIIEGKLTEDDLEMVYSFSANKSDRVTVTLSSRQFDALLQIVDEDDEIVTSNDDAEGSLNSIIDDYEIPTDGDYAIVVTSSDGTEVGDFELTFNITNLQLLSYGDRVQASLKANEEQFYQFEGKLGDVVSIRMASKTLDSFLGLSDDVFEITADDNSGGGLDAMIAAFKLTKTGTYQIRVSSFYSYTMDGEYTLDLSLVAPTPIEVNESITDTISGEPLYYTFDVQPTDTISVYVTSDGGSVDTLLNLKSQYNWLGLDDDSGYGYDPELLNVVINNAEQYTLIILPSSEHTEGEFELLVKNVPAQDLACDTAPILQFSNKITQIPFQMTVERNQIIEITFKNPIQSRELFTYFVLGNEYLPEQSSVYDEDTETWTTTVKAVTSGQLYIMFSDYSQRGTSYEVNVSCP